MKRQRLTFHLRHIGVFSAFKLGCLGTAFSVTGLFLCAMISVTPMALATGFKVNEILAGYALSPALFLIVAVVASLGPGLALAYHALLYNVIARLFGGLSITLERDIPDTAQQSAPVHQLPAAATLAADVDVLNRQIAARRANLKGRP